MAVTTHARRQTARCPRAGGPVQLATADDTGDRKSGVADCQVRASAANAAEDAALETGVCVPRCAFPHAAPDGDSRDARTARCRRRPLYTQSPRDLRARVA